MLGCDFLLLNSPDWYREVGIAEVTNEGSSIHDHPDSKKGRLSQPATPKKCDECSNPWDNRAYAVDHLPSKLG
jgi:hypothetical protein